MCACSAHERALAFRAGVGGTKNIHTGAYHHDVMLLQRHKNVNANFNPKPFYTWISCSNIYVSVTSSASVDQPQLLHIVTVLLTALFFDHK